MTSGGGEVVAVETGDATQSTRLMPQPSSLLPHVLIFIATAISPY